jgi:hypothetical protein
MAMCMVFINCAFPIIDLFGITTLHQYTSNFWLLNAFTVPIINIAGLDINMVEILAIALSAATIVVLNTHAVTDRGIAMVVFAGVFWGSFGSASLSLSGIIFHFPPLSIFWAIFLLACTFIFINAMVQFPLGGEWGQV